MLPVVECSRDDDDIALRQQRESALDGSLVQIGLLDLTQ